MILRVPLNWGANYAVEGEQLSMTICRTQAIQGNTSVTNSQHRQSGAILGSYRLIVGLFVLFMASVAAAQLLENRVTPLQPIDRQYMDVQRQLINELTRRHYGGQCCRSAQQLELLQRLLEDGHVRPEQTQELQAMGVVLGDLLAAENALEWVVFEDIKGRSRALKVDETGHYVFPVTMVSRRWEVADRTPINEIYQSATEAIALARPPRPFEAPR